MTAIACEVFFEPIRDRLLEGQFIVRPIETESAIRRQDGDKGA